MKPLRYLLTALFCLIPIGSANSQTDGASTKPKFVKFKTDPPGGIIIVNGTTHHTSDSDFVWTKVDLSAGVHPVVAKGQAKRLTFDLTIDATRGTFVTVDFDDDQVWTLLEKAFRSRTVAAKVEPDSSTTVTKRKKPAADSSGAQPANQPKDTTGNKVFAQVDDSARVIERIDPKLKDTSKIRDITGPAVVKALVNEKGHVIEVQIDRSSGSKEFDQAALAAGRKCKYKPATRGGKPVATWISYQVDFNPPVGAQQKEPAQ